MSLHRGLAWGTAATPRRSSRWSGVAPTPDSGRASPLTLDDKRAVTGAQVSCGRSRCEPAGIEVGQDRQGVRPLETDGSTSGRISSAMEAFLQRGPRRRTVDQGCNQRPGRGSTHVRRAARDSDPRQRRGSPLTPSIERRNMSLLTVQKVLHGARSRSLDPTSSRAFAVSSRTTVRTWFSRGAAR